MIKSGYLVKRPSGGSEIIKIDGTMADFVSNRSPTKIHSTSYHQVGLLIESSLLNSTGFDANFFFFFFANIGPDQI